MTRAGHTQSRRSRWIAGRAGVAVRLIATGVVSVGACCAQTSGNASVGSIPHLKLIPFPREVKERGVLALAHGAIVRVPGADPEDMFAASELRSAIQARGVATDPSALGAVAIDLLRLDSSEGQALLHTAAVHFEKGMLAEGYALIPEKGGLAVVAAGAPGIFYGTQTVKELIAGHGASATLQFGIVRDWPAMRWRGISDDLSRGPIPTLAYQKQQIRTFAAYKLNVYSPYFENTLEFTSNPLGAAPGGSMSVDDLRELVAYASAFHITIVPEQESFGHLHNLMVNETYSDLAETPHGDVLAPGGAGVIPLIKQWFSEIAAASPGPFLHIGADETFDLGKGKTAVDVERRGLGTVYVDFLTEIDEALRPLHKQLMFWGDVAINEPSLVPKIPKDMIAVPWVYDPQPKGFDQFILPFRQAGIETWVAPSVNNWSKVYPDMMRGLLDIQQFVRDGQRLSSVGVLNTVWNDDDEGLFDLDWYGVVFGASAGWQTGESSIPRFRQDYGSVFHGDDTGKINQAFDELIAATALLKDDPYLGSTDRLYWLDPWTPAGQAEATRIRPILHALRTHAEKAVVLLAEARKASPLRETESLDALDMGARRLDLIGLKFQLSDEIAANYAKATALARTPSSKPDDVDTFLYEIADTNGRCQDLRNAYAVQRGLYERAWLRENRSYALARVLGQYDLAIQLWVTRANTIANVMDDWHRDRALPDAAKLGIPQPAP